MTYAHNQERKNHRSQKKGIPLKTLTPYVAKPSLGVSSNKGKDKRKRVRRPKARVA